ncbi:MAG: type III pantothenate kinase [Oscillospiraceae bacterium]
MLLTINIGNFNILIGAYKNDTLYFRSQVRTDLMKTSDEYAIQLKNLFDLYGASCEELEGAIISSVAPALTSCLREAVLLLGNFRVLTVGPGLKTGLNIKIDNPAQLGADIVAGAVAVCSSYSLPALVVNFDTAISVMAIDSKGSIIGGCISPGIRLSLDALTTHAAQLPQIDLEAFPETVAGTNTIASMEAGLIIGNACMLDGLIDRFAKLLFGVPTVVMTGEFCPQIMHYCTHETLHNPNLICDGLSLIYRRNVK